MSDEQKPNPAPNPFVPGSFPTFRLSFAYVLHHNGQMILSIGEDRWVTQADGSLGTANIELGRYELSPVAAIWLAHNLLQALNSYREKFGTTMPADLLPPHASGVGDVIERLENLLRETRQQPPDAPPMPDDFKP